MKYLLPLVFAALAVVLTIESHPKSVYNEVKNDLENSGVYIPKQWVEQVILTNISPLGVSLDMGSYNNTHVVILIDHKQYVKLSREDKKKLLLHESLHSLFNIKHCRHDNCVMYPYMGKVKRTPYEILLKNTIKNHEL